MALELGVGYLSIVPDGSKFASKLDREIGDDLERAGVDGGRRAGEGFSGTFGASIKKAVGVAAASFAGLQIASIFKDSVDAASDLGEVLSKSAQIFGSESLPELEAFAAGAARSFGQSKAQALDAAATFAVFGKSAGLSGGELTGFSKELVGLTADMASFSNTSPEEAIEAVGAALRGESEPIRRYGVLLDDATLRNRALALGLISTTKEALTPATRVLAAQAEILAQTSDVQGDFARTSGGLANQQRILNALIQDGKAKLGQVFLPAATAVVSFLVSKGIPGFQKFTGALKDRLVPVLDVAAGAVKAFAAAFRAGGKDITSSGMAGAAERVGLVLRSVFDGARGAVKALVAAYRSGGDDITSSGLAGAAERVGLALRRIFDVAKGALRAFVEAFKAGGDDITSSGLAGAAERVGLFLRGVFDGAKGAIRALVEAFRTGGEDITSSGLAGAAERVGQLARGAFDGVPAALKDFKQGFEDAARGVDESGLNGKMADLGARVQGLVDVVRNNPAIFKPLVAALAGLAGAMVAVSKASAGVAALKGAFGFLPLLTNPVVLAAAAIAGLGAAAFYAYQHIPAFREAVDRVREAFQGGGFGAAVAQVGDEFRGMGPKIVAALGTVAAAIGGWVTGTAIPFLRAKAPEWAAALVGWVGDTAVPFLVAKGREFLVGLRDWVDNTAIPYLDEQAPVWGHAFTDWVLDVALPMMTEASAKLVAQAVRFVTEKAPELGAAFSEWIITHGVPFTAQKLSELLGIIIGFVEGAIVSVAEHAAEWVAAMLGWVADVVRDAPAKLEEIAAAVLGFVAGMPSRVAGAAAGMWDGISDAFRSAMNVIVGLWNGLEFSLPSIDTRIPGIGKVGGFTLSTPDIPELAGGGVITSPTLAWLGEISSARPEIVTPEKLMADVVRRELAAVPMPTRTAPLVGAMNVTEAASAGAVVDEVNARLGWMLTTRNER